MGKKYSASFDLSLVNRRLVTTCKYLSLMLYIVLSPSPVIDKDKTKLVIEMHITSKTPFVLSSSFGDQWHYHSWFIFALTV